MKAAVMTEEKLAREDNIEQVKIDIREAYAENLQVMKMKITC